MPAMKEHLISKEATGRDKSWEWPMTAHMSPSAGNTTMVSHSSIYPLADESRYQSAPPTTSFQPNNDNYKLSKPETKIMNDALHATS
jgi:hypothetical protein